MSRRWRRAAQVAIPLAAALLAVPAGARASVRAIQAVDDPLTLQKYWTPHALAAQVGDTIQWRLTEPGNTLAAQHDIWIVPPGGTPQQLGTTATTPVAGDIVDQPGTWQFYCSIHGGLAAGGMNGTITVGTDDPGAPVDPGTPWTAPSGGAGSGGAASSPVDSGPQPAFNRNVGPITPELGDTVRPLLSQLRVSGRRHGVLVRVNVSKPVTLELRLLHDRELIKTRALPVSAGTHSASLTAPTYRFTSRRRYRVQVRAVDTFGLPAFPRSARLRIRP